MALGIYLQPGSLKTPSSIYVGAGGVHNVKEVYVGVDGTAHKAWPAYGEYGNGFNALSQFYYTYHGAHYSTSSTVYDSYDARNTLNLRGHGSERGDLHWYVLSPMDLRGYNYIAMTCTVNATTTSSTFYLERTLYLRPIIATGYDPDNHIRTDDIVYGTEISPTVEYDRTYSPITFIDISNCTCQDKYIKIGYQIGTSIPSDSSYSVYAGVTGSTSADASNGIFFYKNKSDCPFDGDSYWRSFSISYSGS